MGGEACSTIFLPEEVRKDFHNRLIRKLAEKQGLAKEVMNRGEKWKIDYLVVLCRDQELDMLQE